MNVMINKIKDQWKNISFFKAYSIPTAIKQLFLFPYDYYFRKGKSSFPLNIALVSTLKCNGKCKMCKVEPLINKNKKELSFEQIKEFIKKIAKNKPSFVISGGEPFIRKDMVDIIKEIKNNKLSCGVFTNGLLLNEEKIKQLSEAKLDYIAFSLLGPEKIHDKIIKINGAFKKITKNIEYFCKIKKDTKVIIHCTISEDNYNYLKRIVELGKELNIDGVRFGHLGFLTKEDLIKNSNLFSDIFKDEKMRIISYPYEPKIENLLKKIKLLKKKYKKFVWFTPELSDKEIKNWYSNNFKSKRRCFFAWKSLFINPEGEIHPCENFNYNLGNILEKDFKDIWNGKEYINFRKKLKKQKLFPACARCCKL